MEHRVVYTRPYDSEVEYLESPSGNAYINTLIPANKISEFTVRIAPITVPSTFYALGADNGGNTRFSVGYSTTNNGSIQIRLGEYYNGIRYTLEQFDTITLNRLTGKYYVNGTEYTGKIVTNSKTNPNSFILFRARTDSSLYAQKNITRIASFSAKGLNGELVLDLIPVRKGNVGYMYDKVSGKLFGNKGTGNFILGPDVANPVPNIRRVFRFGNKRFVMPMPYGSKVEYLESSGTQYIDTVYSAGTDVKIEVDFKFNDNGGIRSQRLIGKSVGGECSIRLIANKTPYIDFYVWGKQYKYYYNLYDRNFVTFSKNEVSINGVNLGILTFNPSFTDGNFTLLSSLDNYTRIYSCKLWKGSTLVRDFIPVRVGQIGYMYDKVSGKLFGNAGTGQFILGNDIND